MFIEFKNFRAADLGFLDSLVIGELMLKKSISAGAIWARLHIRPGHPKANAVGSGPELRKDAAFTSNSSGQGQLDRLFLKTAQQVTGRVPWAPETSQTEKEFRRMLISPVRPLGAQLQR
jgi:hypothetical protein